MVDMQGLFEAWLVTKVVRVLPVLRVVLVVFAYSRRSKICS